MYFNRPLERQVTKFVKKFRKNKTKSHNVNDSAIDITAFSSSAELVKQDSTTSVDVEAQQEERPVESDEIVEFDPPVKLFEFPKDCSVVRKMWWVFIWPGCFLFFLTIPDVRRQGIWRRLFLLSFIMSVLWIGILTYLVTWFITVIGFTMGAPDSVMGVTALAAGSSVPVAVAGIILAKQGKASVGVSNSIGSNSLNIMICLGLPWLIKAAAFPSLPVEINSDGVVYSVVMLFCSIVIFYFSVALNKFRMNKLTGAILAFFYIVFLVLASLFEMNVFMKVNSPACPT